jgi:hypothetical protein
MAVHRLDFGPRSRSGGERSDPAQCSVLDLELIRFVLALPAEARAKLLAFLHLGQSNLALSAEITLGKAGDVHLTLRSTPSEAA